MKTILLFLITLGAIARRLWSAVPTGPAGVGEVTLTGVETLSNKTLAGYTLTAPVITSETVVSGTKIDVTKPISSKEISNSTVKLAFSAFKAEVRNGAVAAADNLEVAKVYIETDY